MFALVYLPTNFVITTGGWVELEARLTDLDTAYFVVVPVGAIR